MKLCEDIVHEGERAKPAKWEMAEYVSDSSVPEGFRVSRFNACDKCAQYWLSQSWVNVRRVGPVKQERKHGVTLLSKGAFTFHADYVNHARFELRVVEGDSVFRTEVKAWDNAVRNLREFIRECGDPAAVQRAMVDVYRTGYGSVGTVNVRLTPIG